MVTIGGITADVQFAGLTGPGLYQINVKVPDAAGRRRFRPGTSRWRALAGQRVRHRAALTYFFASCGGCGSTLLAAFAGSLRRYGVAGTADRPGPALYVDDIAAASVDLFEAVCGTDMEGIVAKLVEGTVHA